MHDAFRFAHIVVIALLAIGARGQASFMKSYGGSSTDVCNDLVLRADGEIAMAGATQTPAFVFGSSDGFLLRTDLNGTLLNAAASGSLQTEGCSNVEALPDSGLIVVGHTSSFGANFLDILVTRLDKNNNILWSRRIGGAVNDAPLGTALTHDGGIVIIGYFGVTTTNFDHYVVKVSGTGMLVWTRVIAAPGYDLGFAVERTPDNGFVVCGESAAYGANGPHVFVAKLTAAGAVTWRQVYASPGEDHSTTVVPTLDGGYAVAGYTFGYGATSGDAFLMKLTATGALSWFRRYGDGRYQVTRDLVQMPDSTYWFTGHSSTGGFGDPNIFLIHTSKTGVLLSAKEYGQVTRTERANSMIVAPDGGFLIGGEMYNCPLDQFQALLVRTRPGGYCPGCDTTNVVYTSSSHVPAILAGFTLSTNGISTVVAPMIQSVVSTTTLCSTEIPLPVELIDFRGTPTDAGNVLEWTTATERNNERFDLLRSADGEQWEQITSLPGAGNSQIRTRYQYVDGSAPALAHYRLRQVDHDGTVNEGPVVVVRNAARAQHLAVFPNPGSATLRLSVGEGSAIGTVRLLAADGRTVMSVDATGLRTVELNTLSLPDGPYTIVFDEGLGHGPMIWIKQGNL